MLKTKIILILVLLYPLSILAKEYVVVANKTMKSLSKSEIKTIFLKKRTFINDKTLVPLNLQAQDTLRVAFEKELLKMSFGSLKTYWSKQHYLGKRPPLTLKSQDSVKAFIKKVDGSIGYLEKQYVDNDMKILYEWKE